MATGALDSNGIWIYGEDDSEATFSALLNKLGTSTSSAITALPGKILQAAYTSYGTQVNSTTSTPVSTGISIAFTPISATSKIIVMVTVAGIGKTAGAIETCMNIRLRKNSTDIKNLGNNTLYGLSTHVSTSVSGTYVETSGSTTARTYAAYFNWSLSAGTVNVQRDGAESTMTIVEVSQ